MAASALIVDLHLRLGPKLKSKAAKIGAGFVDTCLRHLRAAVSRIRVLRASMLETSPAPEDDGYSGDGEGRGGDPGDALVVDGMKVAQKAERLLGARDRQNDPRTVSRRLR